MEVGGEGVPRFGCGIGEGPGTRRVPGPSPMLHPMGARVPGPAVGATDPLVETAGGQGEWRWRRSGRSAGWIMQGFGC